MAMKISDRRISQSLLLAVFATMPMAQAQLVKTPRHGSYTVDVQSRNTMLLAGKQTVTETTIDGKTGKQVYITTMDGQAARQEFAGKGSLTRCYGASDKAVATSPCPLTLDSTSPEQKNLRFECKSGQGAINLKMTPGAQPDQWIVTYKSNAVLANGASGAQGQEPAALVRMMEQAGGPQLNAQQRKELESMQAQQAAMNQKMVAETQRAMANASPQERAMLEARMKSMQTGSAAVGSPFTTTITLEVTERWTMTSNRCSTQ